MDVLALFSPQYVNRLCAEEGVTGQPRRWKAIPATERVSCMVNED